MVMGNSSESRSFPMTDGTIIERATMYEIVFAALVCSTVGGLLLRTARRAA